MRKVVIEIERLEDADDDADFRDDGVDELDRDPDRCSCEAEAELVFATLTDVVKDVVAVGERVDERDFEKEYVYVDVPVRIEVVFDTDKVSTADSVLPVREIEAEKETVSEGLTEELHCSERLAVLLRDSESQERVTSGVADIVTVAVASRVSELV